MVDVAGGKAKMIGIVMHLSTRVNKTGDNQ